MTRENVYGNHIVLDIGDGAYAFYAHLIKGSVRVKVGYKVRKGQTIAKPGNTGNANADDHPTGDFFVATRRATESHRIAPLAVPSSNCTDIDSSH